MKLAFAETAATQLLELLRPCCEFAAVAGSVHRSVGDIAAEVRDEGAGRLAHLRRQDRRGQG